MVEVWIINRNHPHKGCSIVHGSCQDLDCFSPQQATVCWLELTGIGSWSMESCGLGHCYKGTHDSSDSSALALQNLHRLFKKKKSSKSLVGSHKPHSFPLKLCTDLTFWSTWKFVFTPGHWRQTTWGMNLSVRPPGPGAPGFCIFIYIYQLIDLLLLFFLL